jgi:hypothetical protein
MPTTPAEQPVPARRAFGRDDRAALLSQAASLLLIGADLRGTAGALRARAAGWTGKRRVDLAPARDLAALGVPRIAGPRRRVHPEGVQNALAKRYGLATSAALQAAMPSVAPDVLADLAKRFTRRPTVTSAGQLVEACLAHPHELPRVAAAAAHFHLSATPERSLDVLGRGVGSTDPLVREVAATALARVAPDDQRLRPLLEGRPAPSPGQPSRTTLLVHGPWARGQPWWPPGGDFHTYILTQVRPDLYAAADRFEWSGGYSDAARALGAADLRAWVDAHGLAGLDVLTHSHGGSVAMLASQAGLRIGELVLLSCPVHPDRYLPDFSRVTRVVSVRVHLDLVILVDGGGQRFQDGRIEENVLPIWFDHFAAHDPAVWQAQGVPSMI